MLDLIDCALEALVSFKENLLSIRLFLVLGKLYFEFEEYQVSISNSLIYLTYYLFE